MNKILDSFQLFFGTLDWKLLTAAIVMIIIIIISIYILVMTALSIQRRRIAIKVSLPNLETSTNNKKRAPQFENNKNLEIELVNPENDIINKHSENLKDSYFIQALTMESKQYFPTKEDIIDMPEAEEYEYNKEENRRKQEHLREIAKADTNDTGAITIENLMNIKE